MAVSRPGGWGMAFARITARLVVAAFATVLAGCMPPPQYGETLGSVSSSSPYRSLALQVIPTRNFDASARYVDGLATTRSALSFGATPEANSLIGAINKTFASRFGKVTSTAEPDTAVTATVDAIIKPSPIFFGTTTVTLAVTFRDAGGRQIAEAKSEASATQPYFEGALHPEVPEAVRDAADKLAKAIDGAETLVSFAESYRPAPVLAATTPGTGPTAKTLDLTYWQSVKDSSDPRDMEAYVAQYPSGEFVQLARNRLAVLKPQLQPVVLPPPAPATPPVAVEGRRVALVIGNAQYRSVSPLDNTLNDARIMAATLQRLGFELVGNAPLVNLDRASFVKAVVTFGQRLEGSTVGVFYYAGHGLQMQGANFLVPVDANPTKPSDADIQLVDAALVLRQMEDSGAKLKVVILDACRNNPFGGRGLRDSTGGLAQMRAPEGTLISYATQPGNVAQDGTSGGNSPYTTALSRSLQKRGIDALRMFNEVGVMVDAATNHTQQPWLAISPINGEFYFAGR
jgi:Caspase domain